MNDREALQLQADTLQARMDAIAHLEVRLTEEKLVIAQMQEQLHKRYEELAAEKEAIEMKLLAERQDELM